MMKLSDELRACSERAAHNATLLTPSVIFCREAGEKMLRAAAALDEQAAEIAALRECAEAACEMFEMFESDSRDFDGKPPGAYEDCLEAAKARFRAKFSKAEGARLSALRKEGGA